MTWVTSVRTLSNHRGFRPPLAVGRVQEKPRRVHRTREPEPRRRRLNCVTRSAMTWRGNQAAAFWVAVRLARGSGLGVYSGRIVQKW